MQAAVNIVSSILREDIKILRFPKQNWRTHSTAYFVKIKNFKKNFTGSHWNMWKKYDFATEVIFR